MLEELLTDSNKIPSSDIQELSSSTMQKDNTDEDSYDIESSNSYIFFVSNKVDTMPSSLTPYSTTANSKSHINDIRVFTHSISCITGAGVNELEKEIGLAALSLVSRDNENNSNLKKESAVITRARHRSHVKRCVGHLNQFIQSDLPLDIAAEELRYVLNMNILDQLLTIFMYLYEHL